MKTFIRIVLGQANLNSIYVIMTLAYMIVNLHCQLDCINITNETWLRWCREGVSRGLPNKSRLSLNVGASSYVLNKKEATGFHLSTP